MKTNPLIDKVYSTLTGKEPTKVPETVRNLRLAECKSCPKLINTGNCSECGCFVSLKTEYAEEACPLGKW